MILKKKEISRRHKSMKYFPEGKEFVKKVYNISLSILFLPYSANILKFSNFIALYIIQENKDQLMKFLYLLHIYIVFSAGGGCEITVTTRVETAWKKFRELLPVLTSRHLSYKIHGHVYSSCVPSAMPVKRGH